MRACTSSNAFAAASSVRRFARRPTASGGQRAARSATFASSTVSVSGPAYANEHDGRVRSAEHSNHSRW
jgi:hypothetical protein